MDVSIATVDTGLRPTGTLVGRELPDPGTTSGGGVLSTGGPPREAGSFDRRAASGGGPGTTRQREQVERPVVGARATADRVAGLVGCGGVCS